MLKVLQDPMVQTEPQELQVLLEHREQRELQGQQDHKVLKVLQDPMVQTEPLELLVLLGLQELLVHWLVVQQVNH